jgi:hypothetical protein
VQVRFGNKNFFTFEKKNTMSDNFFESSTAAVGTIFTVIALAILASILIWG